MKRWLTRLIFLAVVCVAGCTPSWTNLEVQPIAKAKTPTKLRAKLLALHWKVDWDAILADPYHTEDDPALLQQLEHRIGKALGDAQTVTIVDGLDNADVLITIETDVQITRPVGSFIWQQFVGITLFAPALLGAPIGWMHYTTHATFTVYRRDGTKVKEHKLTDQQNHYVGVYYGFHNFSTPFDYDLGNMTASLSANLQKDREELALHAQSGAGRAQWPNFKNHSRTAGQQAVDRNLEPRTSATRRDNAVAIVVGIEKYRADLPMASGAEVDARLFAQFAEKTMGMKPEHIHLLTGANAVQSTLIGYLSDDWLRTNVPPDGEVFFYFAGHGSYDADDRSNRTSYLMPWDAEPKYLKKQGVSLQFVYDVLAKVKAKHSYAFIDACFSGTGKRSASIPGRRAAKTVAKAVVHPTSILSIFAATETHETAGITDAGHGIFSYYLLRGLNGKADKNRDDVISASELVAYIQEEVPSEAARKNGSQHPVAILSAHAKNSALVTFAK